MKCLRSLNTRLRRQIKNKGEQSPMTSQILSSYQTTLFEKQKDNFR